MSDELTRRLLDHLGIAGDLQPSTLDVDTVRQLRDALLRNPRKMLADAPGMLGSTPTLSQALIVLDDAERALAHPGSALGMLAPLTDSRATYELPPSLRFEGYDPERIPILPNFRKFEARADWLGWALTAVRAWSFRRTTRKPRFPRHTRTTTSFRYALPRRSDGTTAVALFSDWGTGYYHSRYIARHVAAMEADCAIHLGDVYYTGSEREFEEHFIVPLEETILPKMPFFALNANHEMDSNGIYYFRFLERMRERWPHHVQEGSYFALVSDEVQLVALDTAYFGNGRIRDKAVLAWLAETLEAGRKLKRVNVLLTQSEPYVRKTTALLAELRPLMEKRLVDLWFWGDEHHAALYRPTTHTPFVGACIGHGGYPYYAKTERWFRSHFASPYWAEVEPRLPRETGLLQGLGNNGFCMLRIEPPLLTVEFWDWRRRGRFKKTFRMERGRLRNP